MYHDRNNRFSFANIFLYLDDMSDMKIVVQISSVLF